MASEKGNYAVVWPRGKRVIEGIPYARRLDTLNGKTVGELWDWLFRGEAIFPMLEKELTARYPGVKFVDYNVFGSTHGADEAKKLAALSDKFKEHKVDAVISGIGC